jgi:hypothetical protein
MQIQNPKLAGEKLTLRYATDDDGNRRVVQGDSEGRFEVSERDGTFLLSTPGWRPLRAPAKLDGDDPAPSSPPSPAPPAAAKPALKPPAPAAPRLSAPTKPVAKEPPPPPAVKEPAKAEPSEGDLVAAEIEGLRSKADAMAFAELHSIAGLTEDMKLSEMKERLTAELLEDEEPEGDPKAPAAEG